MQWQGINKDSPENIYFSVYNSGTATLAAGEACKWDLDPANDEGYVNWVETIGVDVSANGDGPNNFAGIVPAGKSIGPAEYGSIQAFGYHPSVKVKNMAANGFHSLFQTAFDAASITNRILVPCGYGTADLGTQGPHGGWLGLVLGIAANISTGHTPLNLAKNYCLPIEQNATVTGTTATTATTDVTTCKAFIRCLG